MSKKFPQGNMKARANLKAPQKLPEQPKLELKTEEELRAYLEERKQAIPRPQKEKKVLTPEEAKEAQKSRLKVEMLKLRDLLSEATDKAEKIKLQKEFKELKDAYVLL